ncbi:glycosyltransferase family A protein [Alteromonas sp. ASW11-130]|uniref:glycosyltransferase family A protein n=1 Tax=Alteromonas sp. ASW11-130 TaxID=3015775 RepID=UPI002241F13F|nr:glycosyltransferase family A protein [Alteromonas sp. ASW11-130]MCW8091283.1 glycosyltransferase family 2 protein [Alteromonas sp. ASW11-130]
MSTSFSVVIPAFNAEKTIKRALDSVLAQTYSAFEILVIDDKSSDKTLDILVEYGAAIKIFKNEVNSGAAASRNTGIQEAKGDYIAFLDADDIWATRKLEIMDRVIRNYSDEKAFNHTLSFETEATCQQRYEQNEEIIDNSDVNNIDVKVRARDEVIIDPVVGTPSAVIETAFLRELGGFNDTLDTAEDIDLWIRICQKQKFVKVLLPLGTVVEQKGSLRSVGSSPCENHIRILDRARAEYGISKRTYGRAKSLVLEWMGSQALCEGKRKLAIKYLSESVYLHLRSRNAYLFAKSILSPFIRKQ